MKKMILSLTALMIAVFSFAQPKQGMHHRPGKNFHLQYEELNLTPDQQAQMKSINEDFHKQMQALNKKEDITVKDQRDQAASLAKSRRQQVEKVLTDSQKQQLAQIKADREKKRDEMAAKRLDRLKENLNLNDAQVATIKSKQAETRSKMKSIAKDDNIARTEKKEQLMALREEMNKSIDNVLTPEQKTKMESLRKEHQDNMRPSRGHRMNNEVDVK